MSEESTGTDIEGQAPDVKPVVETDEVAASYPTSSAGIPVVASSVGVKRR